MQAVAEQSQQPDALESIVCSSIARVAGVVIADVGAPIAWLDSLQRIEVVIDLEDALSIEIADDEAERFTTAKDLMDLCAAKVAAVTV